MYIYNDLRAASKSAVLAWASAINAPVRAGWTDNYNSALELLQSNFLYEAYQRSALYEE